MNETTVGTSESVEVTTVPETTQSIKDFPSLFEKNRYVFIEEGLDSSIAALLAQYAIFDAFQKPAPEPEGNLVPGAHSRYGDALMEDLLLQLRPFIEEVTGLSLFPTYSYYRLYTPGDQLPPHKDRPSCEVSLTVNLGSLYIHPDSKYSWNIWVDGKEFATKPGDMVVYRGVELDHWRTPFEGEPGSWHAQAFLHYVDANGPYSFLKYDARPNVGHLMPSRNQELINFANSLLVDRHESLSVLNDQKTVFISHNKSLEN
jgi:hypothetical protein